MDEIGQHCDNQDEDADTAKNPPSLSQMEGKFGHGRYTPFLSQIIQ
jgi:hypothetical protein